jgi:ribulose-phosphate 3-epimerase
MIKIAPSILASDFSRLGEEISRAEKAGADMIHLDVMDGHFVPNITIGPPVIKSLRRVTSLPFDVHLMIDNPERYIEAFVDAGADILSVHVEKNPHLHRTIEMVKHFGRKASVVLNPATPLNTLDMVLDEVDMVLLMTVNPGFGGQQYIEGMTKKVRDLKRIAVQRGLGFDIEVDGGIDLDNIHEVTEAGANVIVAGSSIFNAPDIGEMIKGLRQKAYGGHI